MNRLRHILLSLAVLLAIVIHSCGSRKDVPSTYKSKSSKTILINTTEAKTADFSDLFEVTRAVRLATNDSVIIGRIDKVCSVEGRFYVLDGMTNYLDIFDSSGRFLFKTSAIGDGYGKYFRIADFDLDLNARLIYLLDDFKRKLILFSAVDGHFVGERPLFNFTVNKFLLTHTNRGPQIIYSRGGTPERPDLWYNILMADTTGHILTHFLPYCPTGTFVLSPLHPLQRLGTSAVYLPPFSNTIFDLTSNEQAQAKYILEFSGSNADFEGMQTTLRKNNLPTIGDLFHYLGERNYIQFLNFLETDSFLYVYYTTQKYGNQFLMYQKSSDSSLLVSTIRHNYFDFSQHLVGVDSDQLISVIEPSAFLDKEKARLLLRKGDCGLIDHFGPNDNPILALLRPKRREDESSVFLNAVRKALPDVLVLDTGIRLAGTTKLLAYPYRDTTNTVELSTVLDAKKKQLVFFFGKDAVAGCDICMTNDISTITGLSNATGIPVLWVTDDPDGRAVAVFRNRHNLKNLFIFGNSSPSLSKLNRFCLVAPIH